VYVCCRRITADALQKNIMPSDDEIGGYYLSRICMERIYLKKSDMFFCLFVISSFSLKHYFFFSKFRFAVVCVHIKNTPFPLPAHATVVLLLLFVLFLGFFCFFPPSVHRQTYRAEQIAVACLYIQIHQHYISILNNVSFSRAKWENEREIGIQHDSFYMT
jgi:hypothetical protein